MEQKLFEQFASAEPLVALRIAKDALFTKIHQFERREFGFLRTFLAALIILRATWVRSRKQLK